VADLGDVETDVLTADCKAAGGSLPCRRVITVARYKFTYVIEQCDRDVIGV